MWAWERHGIWPPVSEPSSFVEVLSPLLPICVLASIHMIRPKFKPSASATLVLFMKLLQAEPRKKKVEEGGGEGKGGGAMGVGGKEREKQYRTSVVGRGNCPKSFLS